MPCLETTDSWTQFLECARERCSTTAFANWLEPIKVVHQEDETVTLQVPNIFVQEYLLENFAGELAAFLPVAPDGQPAIQFEICQPDRLEDPRVPANPVITTEAASSSSDREYALNLNPFYLFDNFIEGPSNQFVKSAAMGVASRPGQNYNPLFMHGGVGLGKTHLLHAVGHYVQQHNKNLRVQCITTEAFINDLVDSLRNKRVDRMKRFYRSLDVLLVDDIQFLQNRVNFEEEFCNTFEALINQNKQIVITSDKPPGQLRLSERLVARMEWGLVAQVGTPDLETRVAILLAKSESRGLSIPSDVAFFIAEHIFSNVRQLEGAVNRLSAHCRLLNQDITEELVQQALKQMLMYSPQEKISVEQILKSVAAVFQVRVTDLRGTGRTKDIALPRQVAMYLAREMISESLIMLAASFGKTHSTLLHACKRIAEKVETDDMLKRQVDLARRGVTA